MRHAPATIDFEALSKVSISDETPLHMRPLMLWALSIGMSGFNLRREAAPHATRRAARVVTGIDQFQSQTRSRSTCDSPHHGHARDHALRFNLRREAAPHATSFSFQDTRTVDGFQSQTRSRSTCDGAATYQYAAADVEFQSQT